MSAALCGLTLSCGQRPPLGAPAPEPLEATSAPMAVSRPAYGYPTTLATARVVAVGDVLMHTNVKKSAKAMARYDESGASTNHEGYPLLFEHVAELVAGADVAFANLETPIAPIANTGTRSMVFNASPALLPALHEVGFDVVSFANNHVYDQGRDGLLETVERLDESPLEFVGSGRTCAEAAQAVLIDANGITIAFLGSTQLFNDHLNTSPDEPCAFDLDEGIVAAEAARAREAGAELVVLSLHWGREYETAPDEPQVALAHRLLDGGVDVLLGHHAHVLQPVEIYETTDGRIGLIAYSLGNFISNQSYWYQFGVQDHSKGFPRDGLALTFDVVRKDYGPGPDGQAQIRTELANVVGVPLWTDNDAAGRVVDSPTIRVVLVDEALDAAHLALEGETDPAVALALKKRIELLEMRRWQIGEIVGEPFFLER